MRRSATQTAIGVVGTNYGSVAVGSRAVCTTVRGGRRLQFAHARLHQTRLSTGSTIEINGKVYPGTVLSIHDDKVYIDGVEIDKEKKEGEAKTTQLRAIQITINGSVEGNVSVDAGSVTITNGGVRGDVSTVSGEVKLKRGNIGGDVSTMSGQVHVAGSVGGDVCTMSGGIDVRGNTRCGRRV